MAPPIPKEIKTVYDGKSKIAQLLGEDFLPSIAGKHVVDFGCGDGAEMIELARAGAAQLTGTELPEVLPKTRAKVTAAGCAAKCRFLTSDEAAGVDGDVAISLDSMEHFRDPAAILSTIYSTLRPGGTLYVSFGWMWYHPTGSHLTELPPWTHVFFSEAAVMGWRALMRPDGARTYADAFLNQMTIARFERLVRDSDFEMQSLRLVPIRPLRWLHNRLTREFTTSTVRAVLCKPASGITGMASI
jgi:2-polyprenyl-3-methyl-5-hydroxy-6-metoxy-1,4-benzoquinol methylase